MGTNNAKQRSYREKETTCTFIAGQKQRGGTFVRLVMMDRTAKVIIVHGENCQLRPTFLMLNSSEHEIHPVHKC